jgi:methyltransferase (TIGR00027 family)
LVAALSNLLRRNRLDIPRSPLENISDTAYWTAICRAIEAERPDAHFRDLFARFLGGERGEKIVQVLRSGKAEADSIAIRTCVFNELILQILEKEGTDTVVNLGAGLDARPYLLPLPNSLRWIEVDLPAILAYKEHKLASVQPLCSLEFVKLDLADITLRRTLFARINREAKQALVITEGLLVYLTPDQVATLAADLYAQPNFRWWLVDLVPSLVLKLLPRKLEKYLAAANSSFKFAPEEGTKFFEREGWKVSEVRSMLDEAHRLKREMPLSLLLRLISRFSSKEVASSFAVLERV